MLFYVSSVAVYRWLRTFYFPNVSILSDQFIIGTVLISLVYIWAQEVQDRQNLQEANLNFILANEKLRQSNINTITSLILSVEAKDEYTSGHSERVMHYSLEIGKRMNLSESDLESLRLACLLHDIGKIGLADKILHKTENLSDEEWDIIKKHPQDGADILAPLDFLDKERAMILSHHERFNGSGYPRGLKGEDIPEGARIIALTDAYDAMKSKRAYREPLSDEVVMEEIKKNSGTQFDPKIVEIFCEFIKNGE